MTTAKNTRPFHSWQWVPNSAKPRQTCRHCGIDRRDRKGGVPCPRERAPRFGQMGRGARYNVEMALLKLKTAVAGASGVILGDNEMAATILALDFWLAYQGPNPEDLNTRLPENWP